MLETSVQGKVKQSLSCLCTAATLPFTCTRGAVSGEAQSPVPGRQDVVRPTPRATNGLLAVGGRQRPLRRRGPSTGGRPRHTASNPRRTLARWPDLPFHSHLPVPRQGHVPWHTRKGSSECAGRRRAQDWAPTSGVLRFPRKGTVTERHRDELKATCVLWQLPLGRARAALPAGRPHATYAPEPGAT